MNFCQTLVVRGLLAFFGPFRIMAPKKMFSKLILVFKYFLSFTVHLIYLVRPPIFIHPCLPLHWRNYCLLQNNFIFLLTLYIVEKLSMGRTDFVTKMRITMNSKADNIGRRIRLERSAMYYDSGVINPLILSLASSVPWLERCALLFKCGGGESYF